MTPARLVSGWLLALIPLPQDVVPDERSYVLPPSTPPSGVVGPGTTSTPEEQPEPAAPLRAQGGWRPLDGVAAQAGDNVVTFSELRRFFDRRLPDLSISTPPELQAEFDKALSATLTLELEAQAGEDMGMDPEQIQRIIYWRLEDQRRDHGTTGFADYLIERGIDPLKAKEGQMEELYKYIWRSSVTGEAAAIGQRPTHDRFVRPGELRSMYYMNKHELSEPDQVQFQVIELPAAAVGGVDAARALSEDIVDRARSGEDFGRLVLEFSASSGNGRGLMPPMQVPALVDDMRSFAETAEVDDISDPILFKDAQDREIFVILRLHSRQPGPPTPSFSDPRVQRFLRGTFLKTWEKNLLGEARERLRDRAFLWTSPEVMATEESLTAARVLGYGPTAGSRVDP